MGGGAKMECGFVCHALRVMLVSSLLIALPASAETITYKGTGTFVASSVTLPLANGGAAMHLTNDIVATIEPSSVGVMKGDCAGLGFLSAGGDYHVDAYCSFVESATDAFDVKAKLTPGKGGSVEVIGGRGKWANATGTGVVTARSAGRRRGSYRYEFTITTP